MSSPPSPISSRHRGIDLDAPNTNKKSKKHHDHVNHRAHEADEHVQGAAPVLDVQECIATIDFLYLRDGSAVITTPDADKMVMSMTGKPLLRERQRVLYDDDVVEDRDPLNLFSIKKFKTLEVGNVENTTWKPVIQFATAAALGYENVKLLVQDVVAPEWLKHHIRITHHGQAVAARATLKVKFTAASATFTLKGVPPEETFKVHPALVNFKTYGLIFRAPFWVNKAFDGQYDPTELIKALCAFEHITLLDADDVPGYSR
jgi:hypothetical protein